MSTKTIDVLLSLEAEKAPSANEIMTWMKSLEKEAAKLEKAIAEAIGKGANADKLKAELKGVQVQIKEVDALAKKEILAKSLKSAGEQADKAKAKMDKLTQVGSRIAIAGAAILAPFALAFGKYNESVKQAESDRQSIISKSLDKIATLEDDRVNVVREASQKIKDIDEDIANNRIDLAQVAKKAEDDSRENMMDLRSSLRDLKNESIKTQRDYKRAVEDVMSGTGNKKEKQRDIKRLKEDYELAAAEIKQKEREARTKAALEEQKIQEQKKIEIQKISIENQKLEQQKAQARAEEARELARIAAEEKKVMAEKQAAEEKRSKTVIGILEANKKWEESQMRVGKIIAEQVLPHLLVALDLVDKVAAFAEANPGVVKAALGIGASMVLIGGAISAVGSVASTILAIKGLLIGSNIAIGATAGGAGGTAAITTAIAGIAPAVGTAILAILSSPLTWAIAALALTVPIMNWLLGTNTTWKEIANTGHQALILIGYGVVKIISGIGSYFTKLGQKLWDGLVKLSVSVVEGVGRAIESIISLFGGNKATGGYMPTGLYNVSEGGKREFALSHSTTRAAESMIGGQLTQQRLLSALGGGRRITYNDSRRIDSSLSAGDRRAIRNDVMTALSGAL